MLRQPSLEQTDQIADAAFVTGPPLSEEQGLGAMTVPDYFREVTERFRAREALVLHEAGNVVRWSYGDLWDRANDVAKALVASGLAKDSRVAVLITNRPEWLAAAFGVWLAGGVVVAVSTFSSPGELEYQLQLSGASVLLFEGRVLKRDFIATLADLEPALLTGRPGQMESTRFPFLRQLVAIDAQESRGAVEGWQHFLERGAGSDTALVEARSAAINPFDPALLMFSSGSTGRPKGIVASHRAVTIQLWRCPRLSGIEEDIRCWTPNGFFWSATMVMTIGNTLSCGGSIVIQPTFDAVEALRLLEVERVTYPIAQPNHWVRMQQTAEWADADLSSVRYVHPQSIVGRHPSVSADWTNSLNSYGGSETFTFHTGTFPDADPADMQAGHGRPLPGNSVKIIDSATGATLPRGESGEIATKGPTLMMGYVGLAPEDYLDGEGFFRSGDKGHIDAAGRLFFEGRLSEVIKTGGAKISLMEVDMALAGFPGVKLAKCVGVPDEVLEEVLIACVVPNDGQAFDEDAARAYLKEQIASYKVPRRFVVVDEAAIPMTVTGKIRLKELRETVMRMISVA